MTGKEICEIIAKADILRKPDGTAPTPREIWDYSPTGELAMIWEWYEIAKGILAGDAHAPLSGDPSSPS